MGEEKIDMDQQPHQQFPASKNKLCVNCNNKQWAPLAPVALDIPMPPKVGKKPETVTCYNCKSQVQTTVKRKLVQHGPYVLWYSIQYV